MKEKFTSVRFRDDRIETISRANEIIEQYQDQYLVACISTCAFPRHAHLGHHEMAFGNFGPGRYAWKIERVTALDIPIPIKGKLGLWNWDVTLCEFCELPLDARMCPSCQEGPTGP